MFNTNSGANVRCVCEVGWALTLKVVVSNTFSLHTLCQTKVAMKKKTKPTTKTPK